MQCDEIICACMDGISCNFKHKYAHSCTHMRKRIGFPSDRCLLRQTSFQWACAQHWSNVAYSTFLFTWMCLSTIPQYGRLLAEGAVAAMNDSPGVAALVSGCSLSSPISIERMRTGWKREKKIELSFFKILPLGDRANSSVTCIKWYNVEEKAQKIKV